MQVKRHLTSRNLIFGYIHRFVSIQSSRVSFGGLSHPVRVCLDSSRVAEASMAGCHAQVMACHSLSESPAP